MLLCSEHWRMSTSTLSLASNFHELVTSVGGLERYNRGIMHVWKFLYNWLLQPFANIETVRSTAYSIFVSCGLKIGDASSLKLYYVTLYKSWNYERVPKRQLVAGIILLGSSKCQEVKSHKASESPKMILSTSKAQELHTASWQAQKHRPCIHRSPGIPSLVRSLVLSGLTVILSRYAQTVCIKGHYDYYTLESVIWVYHLCNNLMSLILLISNMPNV